MREGGGEERRETVGKLTPGGSFYPCRHLTSRLTRTGPTPEDTKAQQKQHFTGGERAF